MRKKRSLDKQIGVLVTSESHEIMETISRRDEVPKSELVRVLIENRLNELVQEEERLLKTMSKERLDEILLSLISFLEGKLHMQDTCPHKNQLEPDPAFNFRYTKEFCWEVNYMFEPFKRRLDTYFGIETSCDCQILNKLIEKQTN